jgi:hypothetical protein
LLKVRRMAMTLLVTDRPASAELPAITPPNASVDPLDRVMGGRR